MWTLFLHKLPVLQASIKPLVVLSKVSVLSYHGQKKCQQKACLRCNVLSNTINNLNSGGNVAWQNSPLYSYAVWHC